MMRSFPSLLVVLAILLAAGCSEPPAPAVLISLLDRFDSSKIRPTQIELEPVAPGRAIVGGEERVAIVAHAPAEFGFTLTVPAAASLAVGVGIADRGVGAFPQADGVRALIWVRDGEGPREILWSGQIPGAPAPWIDLSLPLDAWAGRTVELGFGSENLQNPAGDLTVWSRPLVVGAAGAPPIELPDEMPLLRVERDLLDHPGLVTDGCSVLLPDVEVPAAGVVDLAIQALRDPGAPGGVLGPMRIELAVDGTSLFRRVVASYGSDLTVPARVDVSAYAGQRVELRFDVCDERVGNALLWSKRLWMTTRTQAQRQAVDDGWNLLFLLVDTVRADRVGHLGYERATTPNWDRIARSSRVYEQVAATSSWTQPSVTSLFTGQSPIEHGVIEGVALPVRTPSLSEVIQRRGFSTLGVSANPIVGELEGFHRGFERFVQAPWISAEEVNRLFLDWHTGAQDRRWFAYLHYVDPHAPYEPPAEHGGRFTDGCSTEWSSEAGMNVLSETINFRRASAAYTDADIDCLSDLYDGEIHYWDAQLGRLLAALDERDQLERTLIVITSDHGEEFMEHGNVLHGYNLYEETIHVPLTITVPDDAKGSRVPDLVSLQELPDALYHLLGVRGGPPPRLLEPGAPMPVFAHTTESWMLDVGFTVLASVREEDAKVIYRPRDQRHERYDLASDPREQTDLAAEPNPQGTSLGERLLAWLAGARPQTMQTRGMDEETVEKLRSLGYVK